MANPDYTAQDVPTCAANLDSMVSLKAVGEIGNPLLELPLLNSLAFAKGVGSVTFARASVATYIDRYGVVQSVAIDVPRFEVNGLLMEGPRTNVLQHNNDPTQGIWSKSNLTPPSTVPGPDGVAGSGTRLLESNDGGAALHALQQNYAGFSDNDLVSGSAYLEADELSWIRLVITGKDGAAHTAFVDFTNGVFGGLFNVTSDQMQLVQLADNWWRVKMNGVDIGSGGTTPFMRIDLATDNGVQLYQGDGTKGINVSRAQLEVGAFASSEIPYVFCPIFLIVNSHNYTPHVA